MVKTTEDKVRKLLTNLFMLIKAWDVKVCDATDAEEGAAAGYKIKITR